MLRGRLFSIALATAAAGLLLAQPAAAQTLPFPKRCEEKRVANPPPQVYIDKVNFIGVSFPEGVTRAAVVKRLRRQALNAGSTWLPGVWNEVRAVWQNHGYFQAVVKIDHHLLRTNASERDVALTIHVDPGPQYRTHLVHVQNATPGRPLAFSRWKLRDMIPLHPGEILNLGKFREGLKAMQKFYYSKGYADFSATPGFQIESNRDRVNLNIFVDEGRQYRVGRLEVLGLGPDLKGRLEADLKPGKIFNWARVLDFYQEQKQMLRPDFSPSDDRIYPDPKTGKVVVILDFRACPESGTGRTNSDAKRN